MVVSKSGPARVDGVDPSAGGAATYLWLTNSPKWTTYLGELMSEQANVTPLWSEFTRLLRLRGVQALPCPAVQD